MSEETKTETTPAPEPNAEVVAARLDAAAARHGLEDSYGDVAAALLKPWLAEKKLGPQKEHVEKFMADLKTQKPALFRAAPAANTSPTPSSPAAPAARAPQNTPYAKWRAMRDDGQVAEAEAFYRLNRGAIVRGAV